MIADTDRPASYPPNIPGAGQACDVGAQLDGGAWTLLQKRATLLAALAVIFDGFDNQLLGFAIPAIMADWGITREGFAPALASGLLGMALGSALGGWVGDRIGRKPAIIASVLLFSVATGSIFMANGISALIVLRLLAGMGIGGALPNATALVAEFTPLRHRPTAVIVTIVCVPLGGMLAGVVAAQVLPTLGWRALFVIGGAGGLAVTGLLWLAMPESPRYLVRRPARWGELTRTMSRLGHAVDGRNGYKDAVEESGTDSKSTVATLFGLSYLRDTIALWVSFFACLTAVYMAFNWLPGMLAAQGLDLGVTSSGLAFYNFGGVLGPLACVWLVGAYGSRKPLLVFALGGAVGAFSLNLLDMSAGNDHTALYLNLAVHGLFVNGIQTSLYALAAFVYVTRIRATGVAGAMTFGRLGAIASAFLGAWAIQAGETSVYVAVLGGCMLVTFLAIAAVGRHVPPAR